MLYMTVLHQWILVVIYVCTHVTYYWSKSTQLNYKLTLELCLAFEN